MLHALQMDCVLALMDFQRQWFKAAVGSRILVAGTDRQSAIGASPPTCL